MITAGVAAHPGMSRDDLVHDEREDRQVGRRGRRGASPDAILIVVSNPLDAMCHVAKNVSGFPKERVFGMAGILDTARLQTFLAWETGSSVKDVTLSSSAATATRWSRSSPRPPSAAFRSRSSSPGSAGRAGPAHCGGRRRGREAARQRRLTSPFVAATRVTGMRRPTTFPTGSRSTDPSRPRARSTPSCASPRGAGLPRTAVRPPKGSSWPGVRSSSAYRGVFLSGRARAWLALAEVQRTNGQKTTPTTPLLRHFASTRQKGNVAAIARLQAGSPPVSGAV